MDETRLAARRVGAMVLRYWYLLRGSWPRVLELVYWPTIQMVIWGLITVHLAGTSDWIAQGFGVLIGAVLLWDVLFRGQLGASISFLEEMWSRNLGHLFVSPLRPREWVMALMTMSLIRTCVGIVPAMLLAIPLYDFSIFQLGPSLVAFFALLLMSGWWLSLIVMSFILRAGLGAESLAWLMVFLLAPVACIYYPVETLPAVFQWVAYALPPAHVFEGMRAVLFDEPFQWGHLSAALGLNLVYFGGAALFFLGSVEHARREGKLLQQGE